MIDIIEPLPTGVIQVRRTTTEVINGRPERTHFRWTLAPGQDISDQDPAVQAVCDEVWTPEVIAAYEQSQAE